MLEIGKQYKVLSDSCSHGLTLGESVVIEKQETDGTYKVSNGKGKVRWITEFCVDIMPAPAQATFNLVEGYLKENSRLTEPKFIPPVTNSKELMRDAQETGNRHRKLYADHITSLRSYPILPGSGRVKKEGLVEGVDLIPTEEVADTTQPFESNPELAAIIEWFANNVQVPGTEWNKVLREINNVVRELEDLKRWKKEQCLIMNELDLQAIAKELGLMPGQSIPDKILPAIREINNALRPSSQQRVGKEEAEQILNEVWNDSQEYPVHQEPTIKNALIKLGYEATI